MKTRIGIIFSTIFITVLTNAVMIVAQEAPVGPGRAPQARTQPPSVASVPSTPSLPGAPSTPSVASVPSLPGVPSVPAVPPAPSVPSVDPLADVMFPPDLIMRHARELGLTDAQKSFMRGEIQRATTRFNELQWQLQDAMELLHQTMESNSVNDQQALTQLDKVLDVEREIKRLHVGLGIRIKNQLTSEQKAKLQEMRRAPRPDGQPTPRPSE